jgi:hypothetical protein
MFPRWSSPLSVRRPIPAERRAELLALPEEGRSRAAPRGLSSRSGTWCPRRRQWPVGDGSAGPVTSRLLEALLDIQYGQTPDEFGWMRLVDTDGEA